MKGTKANEAGCKTCGSASGAAGGALQGAEAAFDLLFQDPALRLFREMAETSPAGVCLICWKTRTLIWMNAAYADVLRETFCNNGASASRLSVDDLLQHFDGSGLAEALTHCANTGEPARLRLRANAASGDRSALVEASVNRGPAAFGGILVHQIAGVARSVAPETVAAPRTQDGGCQPPTAGSSWDLFDTVLANTMDRHYVHDLEGRFVYANKTLCRRLKMPLKQLIGKRMEDFPYPREWLELFNRNMAEIRQTGQPVRGVFQMHTLTSRPEWFEYHMIPVFGETGQLQLIAGNSRDITPQKQAEMALRQALERLSLAMEATSLGTFDYYPGTNELVWSDTTRRHWGVPDNVPVSLDLYYAALCPEFRDATSRMIANALNPASGGKYRNEYRIKRVADGEERWIRATGQAIFNDSGEAIRFIGTTQDITESKEVEQRVVTASKHDILTGLPNRALVYEYAAHLLALARRTRGELAMLFIDLDRFKPINDQYGHDAGDRVLQEVARRIVGCIRQADIVGRLGGDEFLVILSHLDADDGAQAVAEHIARKIEQPIRIGEVDHLISCSIGISLFPQHGQDTESLMRAADLAMYAAKAAGRNSHIVFNAGLEAEFQQRMQMEQWLRNVIKRNELYLLYQPIVDLANQQVVGVEALVRIPYGNGISYSPSQFIVIAETAGLIDSLGSWVIEEACRQQRRWREQGLPSLRVSINVSPLQFQRKNFAEQLIATVGSVTSDFSCIEIEVTESTVMEALKQTVETLTKIRGQGIRIALDDFGTGYSSLSRLASLPLDKLKIDQSFVRRLATDSSSRAIAEMIIALGKSMGLEIVGEGVERPEDLHALRELGCDKGQGYLFSRPMTAQAFADWYRQRLS